MSVPGAQRDIGAFAQFGNLTAANADRPAFAAFAGIAAQQEPPSTFANFAQLGHSDAPDGDDDFDNFAEEQGGTRTPVGEGPVPISDMQDNVDIGELFGEVPAPDALGEEVAIAGRVDVLAIRPGAEAEPLQNADALLAYLQPADAAEPRAPLDPVISELLTKLVDLPKQSDSAIGDRMGVDRRRVPELATRMANACIQAERHATEQMLEQLTKAILDNKGRAILFVEALRGDETPLKTKAKAAAQTNTEESAVALPEGTLPTILESSTGTQKIVQAEWMGAALYQVPGGKHLLITFPLCTWLQVVDRTTGECYKEALGRICPNFALIADFERIVRVLTSDRDAAIRKAERRTAEENPMVSHIHFPCHIHIAAGIMGRVSELMKDGVSCLVELALCLGQAGAMAAFRKALREVLQQDLRIRLGAPPSEHEGHRRSILDLAYAGSPAAFAARRSVVEGLANGDWSRRDVVEHWASGPVSRSSIVNRFQKLFVWAVASASPRVFPRHRWTGAEDAIRWVLLLMSCHGLLAKAWKAFAGRVDDKEHDTAEECEADGTEANKMDVAIADPAVANTVQNIQQKWIAQARGWKRNALAWVSDDNALPQLVLFRYVHEGHRAFMQDLLTMSGSQWQRTQAWQELQAVKQGKGGWALRDFRATVAESGRCKLMIGEQTAPHSPSLQAIALRLQAYRCHDTSVIVF